MRTSNIINGMQILQKYYENSDGHNCSAEHDIIYMFATEKEVSEVDRHSLEDLGWYQENLDYDEYDQDEPWCCNT